MSGRNLFNQIMTAARGVELAKRLEAEGVASVYSFCLGDTFQITNETTGEVIVEAVDESDGMSALLGLYEDAQKQIAAVGRDAELGRLVRQAVDAKFSIELWRGFRYVAALGSHPAQSGDTLEEAVRKALELVQP